MMSFSDNLRRLRKERGMTQEDLAKVTNLSKGAISMYESGKREPKFEMLEVIADFFNVDMNILMDKNKKPQSSDIDIFSIPNIEPLRLKKVPILGTIAAGVPITAEENFNGFAECDVSVKADFALKIQGESMINAGIEDGDYVFIHAAPVVNEGQIAAVLIDGEATLKRFYRHGQGIELRPANDTMKSFFYNEGDCDEFRILGRAVAVLHAL